MVMSESYKVQARVYDRMEELEHRKQEQPRTYEVVMQEALLLADQKVKELENKIQIDKPKVIYADAVSGSDTSVLVEEWVKSLASHIIIGRNRAFAWLRNSGYLRSNNLPYQQYIDRGMFECRENLISTAWGQKTNYTTLVTGKGRVYLLEKLIQDHRKNQTELDVESLEEFIQDDNGKPVYNPWSSGTVKLLNTNHV